MPKNQKSYKRWTAKRKFEVVLDMLKSGITLDELSRATGQPAHTLSQWRDEFLSRGESLFKEPESSQEKAQDQQIVRLKAKVGEVTMENDLLYEKIKRLEHGTPFHMRRSKP